MGQFKSGLSFLVKILILLAIVSNAGCTYLENILVLNEPTVESVSQVSQEPVAMEINEPTPLPTWQPVPHGLIRIPVTGSAKQTAADLNSADRPAVNRYRLAQELKGMTPDQLAPKISSEYEFQINDLLDFIVNKDLAGDNRALPARLRHISENAYWWTSATTRAEDDQIITAAQNFEEQIVQINRQIFGRELLLGVDNDPRIHILLVEEPGWGDTIGYSSIIHKYPSNIAPLSNQKEMIFVNLGAVSIESKVFAGELAHEYNQLIHWNQDPNEDLWLKEAMSKLARFLSGAPPRSNTLGLTNAELFAEYPSIQLTSRPEQRFEQSDKLSFAHNAAERLFAVYLLEQYGSQLIKDIVKNPAPGVLGIREELAKLPGSPSFEDVYATWTVANLLNRTSLAVGQYGYQKVRPVPPLLELVRSFDGEPLADQLPPYGARYYEVLHKEPVRVNFIGSTLARLTPADPPSGEYAWYSNRGDETEFTLTRTLDLSSLDEATLKFKTWYQLEEFYDFAYLEVSTDGGSTWEILDTIHGTDQDPNNLSLGVGYTGSTRDWVLDFVDLSPYTGQEIQIRFHVITDFTTNGYGFQVDHIAIPELGYLDGAEDDLGGWEACGFVRSSNLVPVEWTMWLVEFSVPIQVERIALMPDQTAEFEITGLGEDFTRAAIVISPTAPVTTMEIDYEIGFKQP